MTFEEYLSTKKIDSNAFQQAESQRWSEWKHIFGHMSADSFTAQKLFLINPIRRKYPIKAAQVKQ